MLRIALSAAALLCAPAAAAAAAMSPGAAAKPAPTAVPADAAGAGASAEAPVAKAVKTAKPAGKLVCRREQATGSRTNAPRVCLTKEQWKAIDREG